MTGNEVTGAGFLLGLSILLHVAWFPMIGLRILKPQEALVLTLFGNYIGTFREPGFYFVNPFCDSVNPAANTKACTER